MAGQFAALILLSITGFVLHAIIKNIGTRVVFWGRAKEGSTKANMHTFQLSAEDYGVQNDGAYAAAAANVAALLPQAGANFKNPFTGTVTSNYEDRASFVGAPSATSGITSYADSLTTNYNIKGYGKAAALTLVLTAGQ